MIDTVTISTFKSKNDNLPKRCTLSWSQFIGLFTKPRRTACTQATCKHAECVYKNGRAWSAAVYKAGAPRGKKNVDILWLLPVDVDHETEETVIDLKARFSKYQYIIHASHSDRPASPSAPCTCGSAAGALHGTTCPSKVDRCIRIIFTLSRAVTNAEWPRFWRAAMQALGIPADPACCDSSRLFFCSSRPNDSDYYFATNDGDPLDVEAILATAPADSPTNGAAVSPTIAKDLQIGEGGVVGKGQRHAMLTSIAGALRFRGAGEQEILIALRNANAARCSPPKSDQELQDLARWAVSQPTTTLPPPDPDPRRQQPIDTEAQPNGPTDEDEDFTRDLKSNKTLPSQENVDLALRKLGVRLRYNEFSNQEIIEGLAGYGPQLTDAAVNRLWLTIDAHFGFKVPINEFHIIVADRARLHRFHPVRAYLNGVSWDGIKRLGDAETPGWLTALGGAVDSPYVRAVSRLVLVAAVRRIREPGVKFDELLVIEGNQGVNKSGFLRILAVDDSWFSDDLPLTGDTKLFLERTSGKWMIEASELKGMSRTDITTLKQCLSRQIDTARMSYGRKETVQPRQFILIGTTNEKASYLRDQTGNRRFWPVRILTFDLDLLRKWRDQLWAEAAAAESAGESIRLDPALYDAATAEQEARTADDDPLVDSLSRHLSNITGKIRIADAYALAGIESGRATHDQITRFGHAIRELGWERAKRTMNGQRVYAYVRGEGMERDRELTVEIDQFGKLHKVVPFKSPETRPN